jgi:hypothetical protein
MNLIIQVFAISAHPLVTILMKMVLVLFVNLNVFILGKTQFAKPAIFNALTLNTLKVFATPVPMNALTKLTKTMPVKYV